MSAPKADFGAGASTSLQKAAVAGKELQHGNTTQFARALAMGSYFLTGIMAVNISQFIGTPLYLINKDWYNAWIAFTKQSVGLLVTTMTQFWAPTTVIISGDKSMRGQLLKTVQGNLYCDFPERLVFIANHQIYTDWLYIWWLAYASGMHGRIYIVLKESLRRIPLIGWGMQFSKFIFLKRNWEHDKPNLARHMKQLNKRSEPMWLTIFPEGTNLAPSTRRASSKWAEKQGINDLRHALLPRSTGLKFMLEQLRETCDWVYDCTIAYEGVPRGQFAQDIYTLRAMYAGGRGPESVSMHFRRFHMSTIPVDDADAFEKWLRSRWSEKDNLLEHYLQHGHFPADSGAEQLPDGKIRRGAGHIKTQIKANKWYEFLQVFAPLGLFAMILYTFYGALPKKFIKSFQRQAIQSKIDMIRKVGQQAISVLNKPKQVQGTYEITNHQLAILKKSMAQKNITINQDTIQKALEAGFFKPKNGLPITGTNKLAIMNGAIPQFQAAAATQKSGLSAAEKRAKARQHQATVAAATPSTINTPTSKPQINGVVKSTPTTTPKNRQTTIKPVAQVAQPARKALPSTSATKTVTTTKPKPTSTQPTKKPIPKLGPSSISDTRSVASTTSSNKSIPKLEIRSNNNTKPSNNNSAASKTTPKTTTTTTAPQLKPKPKPATSTVPTKKPTTTIAKPTPKPKPTNPVNGTTAKPAAAANRSAPPKTQAKPQSQSQPQKKAVVVVGGGGKTVR